jgi:hypothetical protein
VRARAFVLVLASSVPTAWAQAPIGSEFQVNTYTTGSLGYPSVAASAAGSFMVVWDSYPRDGSESDVWARLFDASSTPLSAEFLLSAYATGFQGAPRIATQPGGGFVVVWHSNHEGSYTRIFARRFDATGAPSGAEFRVNTDTSATQSIPDVDTDGTGDFVVAWQGQQGDFAYNVWARRFNDAGAALGAEFRVNSFTTSSQVRPRVAVDAAGNFVVVWHGFGEDGDDFGVAGQRYDAAGLAVGGEFQVNTHTASTQSYADVASDAAGNFVVTWMSYAEDGDNLGVFARRYDTAGTPGGAFRVNAYTQYSQRAPAITADASGAFVVAWHSEWQDGQEQAVIGARVSPQGVPGAEFRLNTYTTGYQVVPALAADNGGNVVAVWLSEGQDGSGDGVFGQRFWMDVIFRDGFEP